MIKFTKFFFCMIAVGLFPTIIQAAEPVYAGHNVLKPTSELNTMATFDTFQQVEDPSLMPYMPGLWGL